ncbi:MAG: NAD(P)H-hydrate dehydratase [Betaproteobacteria bacterium]
MSQRFAALPAIYSSEEIRSIETIAQIDAGNEPLMERAGLAAAELARDLPIDSRKPILIFAGPGNNGGDAFVVARHLRQWWHKVEVVFAGERDRLSTDAGRAFDAWRAIGGEVLAGAQNTNGYALVIDGLFGIGLQRDVRGVYAELVRQINAIEAPVLALDIPTGLHADSGRVLHQAVLAEHTITFIALKPGLLTLDGPDQCGEIHVRDLGIDVEQLVPPRARLLTPDLLAHVIRPRRRNSHKGSFGNVGIVGGAAGMTGAALLAGRAALKLGAGRVYVGLLDADAPRLDPIQPELMLRDAKAVLGMRDLTCLVLGPGLSRSSEGAARVEQGLRMDIPLVIDADALSLIGDTSALQDLCRERTAATVMTPHPAEAGRLRQTATADIQHDRVTAASALAGQYRAIVALKGAGTVVALQDGAYCINASGNPGLSTAGTGDVLSGMLAALIAQGADPVVATCAAVHLHGAAADRVYTDIGGPVGMTASELLNAARSLLNAAIYANIPPL